LNSSRKVSESWKRRYQYFKDWLSKLNLTLKMCVIYCIKICKFLKKKEYNYQPMWLCREEVYYFLFTYSLLLLCWMGVHCGTYKSSYDISNISYLNSPPPSLSFISPSSSQCVSFFHLCTCVQKRFILEESGFGRPNLRSFFW
jgi:hypothetical protein